MHFLSKLGSFEIETNPKRKRRQVPNVGEDIDAVIQLTGGVLQSLFSVAYTDDVRKVVDRIDNIDAALSKDITKVKTSQDSLQQRTVDTLSKQDNTIQKVEKMARVVERKVRKSVAFSDNCFVSFPSDYKVVHTQTFLLIHN